MDNDDSLQQPKKRLEAIPCPPFRTINALKDNTTSYLQQYRLHQWLAASRSLLPNVVPEGAANAIPKDEYPPDELHESNEMLLARLHRVKHSLQSLLSEIHSQIDRLQKAQLSKRSVIWLKPGILTFLASAFLSILLASTRRAQSQPLHVIPRLLQPLIPLIPFPFAIYFIAVEERVRERGISCINTARARLEDIQVAVENQEKVSNEDISWLAKSEWDGVDWSTIGL